jgi:hypothetical protein
MNHSARRQHHEQARKRHKHEKEQQARQAAKKPRSAFPRVLLAGAIAVIVAFVFVVAFTM